MPNTRIEISDQAVKNVKELAEYLKGLSANKNSATAIDFDMEYFCKEENYKSHNCGTSACAVGHFAIMIGAQINEDFVVLPDSQKQMGWMNFCRTYIGISSDNDESIVWDWLFSGDWDEVDNTALGAVARIEHFLEHGIPTDFSTSKSSTKYNGTMVGHYIERRKSLEAA